MEIWEYLHESQYWDGKNYVASIDGKVVSISFQAFLNHYGSLGWELVGVVIGRYDNHGPYPNQTTSAALSYEATFKRRRQA